MARKFENAPLSLVEEDGEEEREAVRIALGVDLLEDARRVGEVEGRPRERVSDLVFEIAGPASPCLVGLRGAPRAVSPARRGDPRPRHPEDERDGREVEEVDPRDLEQRRDEARGPEARPANGMGLDPEVAEREPRRDRDRGARDAREEALDDGPTHDPVDRQSLAVAEDIERVDMDGLGVREQGLLLAGAPPEELDGVPLEPARTVRDDPEEVPQVVLVLGPGLGHRNEHVLFDLIAPEDKRSDLVRLAQLPQAFRSIKRVPQIVRVLGKYGFGDVVNRMGVDSLLHDLKAKVFSDVPSEYEGLTTEERIRLALD